MSIEPNNPGFWEKKQSKTKHKHIKKHTPRYQEEQIQKLKTMDTA